MIEDIPQVDINPPTMIRSNEHHALAIEHNGLVFVKTPAAWHELAKELEAARAEKDKAMALSARSFYLNEENARLRDALENLFDRMLELRAEWTWKANEPRNGNQAEYESLDKECVEVAALLDRALTTPQPN